tara:strand:+ start:1208 stop:1366 length:159 start_codon:yes stop_codon:yes gene_type:complete
MNIFYKGIELFIKVFKVKIMPKGIGYKNRKKLSRKSGKRGKGKSYTFKKKKR